MPISQTNLAFIIWKLRKSRHWTQAQLAEASGVSRRTVQEVERDASKVKVKTIRAILDALHD